MKLEKRSVATCIVLSIVTLGIYGIIWSIKIGREAASIKDPADRGTTEALLLIFLPFVGTFLTEKKMYEGCVQNGFPKDDRSVVYLLLCLLVPFGMFISFGMLQSDLNKYANALLNGFTSAARSAVPNANTSVLPVNIQAVYAPTVTNTKQESEEKLISELRQYKTLLDQGILTEEEFQAKKKALLGML